MVPLHGALATDYTLTDNSSAPTLADNDTVTITQHYGADNNTNSDLIEVGANNISISVSGTLQGHDDLIVGTAHVDNLSVTIAAGGEVVASGTRAIDIDGSNRIQDNVTLTNDGTIYATERFAVSAKDVRDSSITNNADGLMSASDRTMLLNGSENLTVTNYGSMVANNDNITYRDGLTLTRTSSTPGYVIAAGTSDELTLNNEGTISTNGERALFLNAATNATITNSGTITAEGNEAIDLEQASDATITNSGTISGADNTIYGDELEDSLFTNDDNGTITASGDIALYLQYADNATFVNKGTLSSSGGSVIDTRNAVSATITNSGTIATAATGSEYILTGRNTTFTNEAAGTITSAAEGLNLDTGNEFRNYGSMTIADNATAAIAITGNNNTIRLYDGSSLGGDITASSGTTGNLLSIDNDETMSLSDNLSGAIGLTKLGDGTLTITGAKGYTGATTLTEGTLKMNGVAEDSTITIGTAGTLGGSGTTGDIINNGTLAPGNSIGTLNVTGDVTLNNASTLEIEVTGKGSSDKIVATGAVSADGVLKLIPTKDKTFGKVETYDIITGASASGTFNSVSIRACGADISTNYTATGVTITLTNCYGKKGDALQQIENYINKLYDENPSADLSTVLTALEGLSGSDYEDAIGSLDIDAPQAIAATTSQNIRTVNGFIAQRAAIQSGNNSARQTMRMMMSAEPLSSDNKLSVKERLAAHSRKGMWVKAYGGDGEKKPLKELGVNGYDYDYSGTTIGFDLESETIKNGLAITLEKGSVTSNKKQGYQEYETVMLNYQNSQFFKDGDSLSLSTAIAMTKVDNKRYIDIGAIERTAKADYQTYTLDLTAGYSFAPMRLGPLTNDLTLSFGLNYNTRESYRETGADSLNLTVDPKHTAKAQLGLENTFYLYNDRKEGKQFMPFVSAGLFASRHLTNTATKQAFAGASKVKVITDRDQEAHGEIGLGFVHIEEDDDELRFLGKAKYSDKVTEYSASLDYGIKF